MMVRHGDVLLAPAGALDELGWQAVPPVRGRVVLALGERSGDAHVMPHADATLWERAGTPVRLLLVTRASALTHEEHAPLTVEPGAYFVHTQRTYEPPSVEQLEQRRRGSRRVDD